jgi:serine/threonine protein kinase
MPTDIGKIFPCINSKSAMDLIQQLLHIEPDQRITASEALDHPFFKDDIPIYNQGVSILKRNRAPIDTNQIL